MTSLRHLEWIALAVVLFGLLTLWSGCGSRPPEPAPVLHDVPAQHTVADLTARQIAATVAAVDARAKGDDGEAKRQQALADELGKLRTAAELRATAERSELAHLAEQAAADADTRAAARQRASDRRWALLIAGLGIALSGAAAGLLTWWGVPRALALGAPAALTTACLIGSAWFAAGDVLLYVLGGLAVLAVLAVAGLAVWVAIHLVREMQHYAAAAAEPTLTERQTLDEASIARQPAVVRWLIDRLLKRHPVTP